MEGRLTDADKWTKDKWFRKLPNKYKLFWIYMNDTCDRVGVWVVDFDQTQFYIEENYDIIEVEEVFKDKIYIFDNGSKWWILDFVKFQYTKLIEVTDEELKKNPNKKHSAHKKYIKMLKEHGLWELYQQTLNCHSTASSETLDCHEYKEREIYKEEELEGEKEKNIENKKVMNTRNFNRKDLVPTNNKFTLSIRNALKD